MENIESKLYKVSLRTRHEDQSAVITFVEYKPSARVNLPNVLVEYDPDPCGAHGFSDQRRLDTAFAEYQRQVQIRIKHVLELEV